MSDLIDSQAFIEQERKLYCEDCCRRQGMKNGRRVFCYEIGEAPCRACWLDDVLGHLEDFPTASPWHRVEDELPNDTRDVLAVRRYGNDLEKQEVIVAHLSVIMDMKRGFNKWWNATNITHWMPFPEPPKEDA